MNAFRSVPAGFATPARAGLLLFLAFSALVFFSLARYPLDIAATILIPSLGFYAASLRRTRLAVEAMVLLFPLLPLLPTHLGVANASLVGYLLLATAAGRATVTIRGREPLRIPRTPIDAPLAAFLACVWISCLTAPFRHTKPWSRAFLADLFETLPRIFFYREGDVFLGLSAAVLFTLGVFFFIELWARRREIGFDRLLVLLLVGATVSVAFAFYQRASGRFIPGFWLREGQAPRVNGLFHDPNSFGTYVVALLFLFGLLARGGRRLPAALAPFLLATLVFTGSRAAWASFVLAAAALAVLGARSRLRGARGPGSRRTRRALVAASVFALLFLYAGYEYALRADMTREQGTYLGRVLTLFNRSDTFNHLLKGRPTMWYTALRMMKEFPATGVGFGLYREVMPHFLEEGQTYWWARMRENAHNYFLQLGGELGLPGLVSFVWICVAVFAGYAAARRRDGAGWIRTAGVIAVAAFLLTTLGAHPLIQVEVQILFWILVVLTFWQPAGDPPAETADPDGRRWGRLFGLGLVGVSLVAGILGARRWFPYGLYDPGTNPWENMGSPGNWTARTEWFRWTRGSAVLLVRETEPRVAMRIKLGRPGVAPGEQVKVATRLGKRPEETFGLTGEEEREVTLDLVGFEDEVVPFHLRVGSVWNGLSFRGQRDWRTLGARVYPIFPKRYPPGYSEGLGAEEDLDGVTVRFVEAERAFMSVVVEGGTLALPIWTDGRSERGRLEVFLDRKPSGFRSLGTSGWEVIRYPCSKARGDRLGITLRAERTGDARIGVGSVSWLP